MRSSIRSFTFYGALLASLSASYSSHAQAVTSYSLGIEGFHDKYEEKDLGVDTTTNYGSVTGYVSREARGQFIALDGRISHGKDDYSSPSGSVSGVPQWESDIRLRYGLTYQVWGGELSPYIGVGNRYFLDEGKGYVTDLGAQAYDRRILQFYVPVGTSLSFNTEDGWIITPQAETDFIFYGNVDSRLTNVVSPDVQFLNPANNQQSFGLGFRGELMVGKQLESFTVQAGPFFRYWWVPKSDSITYDDANTNQPAATVYEPQNTRLQIGAALRVLW